MAPKSLHVLLGSPTLSAVLTKELNRNSSSDLYYAVPGSSVACREKKCNRDSSYKLLLIYIFILDESPYNLVWDEVLGIGYCFLECQKCRNVVGIKIKYNNNNPLLVGKVSRCTCKFFIAENFSRVIFF